MREHSITKIEDDTTTIPNERKRREVRGGEGVDELTSSVVVDAVECELIMTEVSL